MIARLLDGSATDFTRIGIPLTDCISCTVQEERNGVFELTAVVSTTTPYFDTIKVGMLIVAKPNHTQDPQAFEIYEISKPINQQVTIRANHISYRQSFIPVKPFSCTGITATLSGLISNAMETSNFTFSTDISNETSTYNQIEPASMRSRLGGVAGSVLDVFGGEYEWDNFETILHLHRGADNGVQLRLGKNITNLEQTESLERVVTGVLPYWSNSDGTLQYYGDIQYSSAVDDYPTHRTIVLDLSSDFESAPTKTQLNNAGQAYLAQSNLATPNTNVAVQFIDLADTTEYADSPLERVNLCDTVEVIYPALDISYKAKAIKVVFDVLAERTLEVEVGDTRSTISKTIADVVGDIDSQVKLGNKLVTVTQKIDREVGSITQTIGEIEEDVSGVTERVTQVEQTTEGISQTVSEHTTQIQTAQTTATSAQETADGALSKANANADDISDLDSLVTTVETNLQTQITQNKNAINLKANESTVTTLRSDLEGEISQAKTDLQGEINVEKDRVSTLVTRTDTIDGKVDTLGSAFVVEEDGAKVMSVANGGVVTDNYTQIKTDGMHIVVNQTEVAWNTADGSGTPQMTIAPDSEATSGWQFRMDSENRLNINWHS